MVVVVEEEGTLSQTHWPQRIELQTQTVKEEEAIYSYPSIVTFEKAE